MGGLGASAVLAGRLSGRGPIQGARLSFRRSRGPPSVSEALVRSLPPFVLQPNGGRPIPDIRGMKEICVQLVTRRPRFSAQRERPMYSNGAPFSGDLQRRGTQTPCGPFEECMSPQCDGMDVGSLLRRGHFGGIFFAAFSKRGGGPAPPLSTQTGLSCALLPLVAGGLPPPACTKRRKADPGHQGCEGDLRAISCPTATLFRRLRTV